MDGSPARPLSFQLGAVTHEGSLTAVTTVLIVPTTTCSEVVPEGPQRGVRPGLCGGAQSVILEHWGLMGSQPPLFFPTPVSGGLVLWVLNAAGISCKAPQKGICDIIIIYVTLCILKHSVRLIFSCHPQNTPVRTEQLTFFFLRFTFGSFFFF